MAPEVRAGGELRVAGRTLTGRAMVYGDHELPGAQRERIALRAPLLQCLAVPLSPPARSAAW